MNGLTILVAIGAFLLGIGYQKLMNQSADNNRK